jgi:hypothetical protein
MYIQNVPGGNVNILGGHGIGNSKQKSVYVHVSYSERGRAISLNGCKTVDKEILRIVSNKGIYCFQVTKLVQFT